MKKRNEFSNLSDIHMIVLMHDFLVTAINNLKPIANPKVIEGYNNVLNLVRAHFHGMDDERNLTKDEVDYINTWINNGKPPKQVVNLDSITNLLASKFLDGDTINTDKLLDKYSEIKEKEDLKNFPINFIQNLNSNKK